MIKDAVKNEKKGRNIFLLQVCQKKYLFNLLDMR